MQTGTEDDGIEQVDGENSVNRRTFVQGVGMLPLSTSLLDNEEARQQLDLGIARTVAGALGGSRFTLSRSTSSTIDSGSTSPTV